MNFGETGITGSIHKKGKPQRGYTRLWEDIKEKLIQTIGGDSQDMGCSWSRCLNTDRRIQDIS